MIIYDHTDDHVCSYMSMYEHLRPSIITYDHTYYHVCSCRSRSILKVSWACGEEQMQELKDTFDMFDLDGGGALDDKEVKHMMKSMGQQ